MLIPFLFSVQFAACCENSHIIIYVVLKKRTFVTPEIKIKIETNLIDN